MIQENWWWIFWLKRVIHNPLFNFRGGNLPWRLVLLRNSWRIGKLPINEVGFDTFWVGLWSPLLQCQQPPHSLTCHLDYYGILIIRQASPTHLLNQNLRDNLVLKLKFSRFSKTVFAIIILIIFSRWVIHHMHHSHMEISSMLMALFVTFVHIVNCFEDK
jgi:hypothetical protein